MESLDLYTGQNKTGTHYRWLVGTVVHPSTGSNTDLPNNQYYYGDADPNVAYGTNIFAFMESRYASTDTTITLYTQSNDSIVIEYYGSWGTKYINLTFNRVSSSGGYYNEEGFGLYLAVVKQSPVLEAFRVVVSCKQFRLGQSAAYQFSNSGKELVAVADIRGYEPFTPGGYSGPGGGESGNFSEDSDTVTADGMPTISAVGSGFSTLFTPTKAQLRTLGDTLWGNTIVGFFQNAITNIKELFVSLGILPFVAPAGATVNVTWMDIATIDIPLTLASEQFVEKDMGSINLATNANIFSSDSVLDYSPYSKLGIYLPFIGYQELDIDECRGSVVGLRYRIDILSGSCVAIISINGNDIYQFSGNCLTQIPLTSADFSGLLNASVQVATAAASMGATAAVASAGDAVTAEMAGKDKITANQAEMQHAQHAASVSNAKGSLVSATANGMMGMKPNYKKSGAVSASTSMLNVKQPYLFLTTPRQSYPEDYGHFCGFPCNITDVLGNFSGYTVVEDIRLNGLVATSSEVEEIYQLLKSGVII